MKKALIFIIITILVIVSMILIFSNKNKEEVKFETVEDIVEMMNKIKKNNTLPDLETKSLDMSNLEMITFHTGIKSVELIDSIVVNESLISSQAYSVLAIKVKNIGDVEKVKKEIYDNINMNKWICVSADKLVITNTNNLVFVVMTSNDWFDISYNEYKKYVSNKIGEEYIKESEEIELPPEVLN